jgi:hypothetical protein
MLGLRVAPCLGGRPQHLADGTDRRGQWDRDSPRRTDTRLTLTAYTAELGSASEDALKLLASWAATHDQANQAATTGPTDSASP